MMQREALFQKHLEKVSVIVSTMDSWLKLVAGGAKGMSRRVVQNLEVMAILMDECQAYEFSQAFAASIGMKTLICSGDVFQEFGDRLSGQYTRSPWTTIESVPRTPMDVIGDAPSAPPL